MCIERQLQMVLHEMRIEELESEQVIGLFDECQELIENFMSISYADIENVFCAL